MGNIAEVQCGMKMTFGSLHIHGAQLHGLLYADDLLILAYSNRELHRKVACLRKYCKDKALEINQVNLKF